MIADFGGEVDTRAFERACEDYAAATGKTLEAALWRQLRSWALKAYKSHRARVPSSATRSRVNALLPAGSRGADWQWRLVEWLMARDGIHEPAVESNTRKAFRAYRKAARAYAKARREFARTERSARTRSAGFGAHMIMGLAKAAEAKGDAVYNTGIRGSARLAGGGLSRTVDVDAASRYTFDSPESRARVPRAVARLERALLDAFDRTLSAQVADIEDYIARKLEGRP